MDLFADRGNLSYDVILVLRVEREVANVVHRRRREALAEIPPHILVAVGIRSKRTGRYVV